MVVECRHHRHAQRLMLRGFFFADATAHAALTRLCYAWRVDDIRADAAAASVEALPEPPR